MFYLNKTVENGWSRAVLLNFLDTNLYERQGKAVNNFNKLLVDSQSELAAQTLKDPYNFDFLTLDGEYRERELEQGLTQNVTIGISEYQLSKLMPENIQSQLPTIEDIEATLSDIKETKD